MKKLFIIFFVISSIGLSAQNDPQAKAILDQVSAKTKAYKTISTNFTINSTNTQNGEKTSQKGSLLLKGDKYVVKLPGSEIYFDGKDVYNYLPESKEVNITKPDASQKSDDLVLSNPKDIFKIYQKDFKYKFIKESTVAGKSINEVDLYPIDLKKKFSRIRMQIDKTSSQIISLTALYKDGMQFTVNFDKFEVNKDLPDSLFIFDTAIHSDTEVIDLRF